MKRIHRAGIIGVTFSAVIGAQLLAQAPATAPTTQPAPTTSPGAHITPEARELLDAVRDAYAKLDKLRASGSLSGDFDVAGKLTQETSDFAASYEAPDRFRHQIKEDLLIGSDGKSLYIYASDKNVYAIDAVSPDGLKAGLPESFDRILRMQNPSLVLAIMPEALNVLANAFESVERTSDVDLEGVKHPVLRLKAPGSGDDLSITIHPETHLLRRVVVDRSKSMAARGAADVRRAEVIIDYPPGAAEAPATNPAADPFAFVPPEGARELVAQQQPQDPRQNAIEEHAKTTLMGKPAPAFALKDLDGKTVALADLKGSVVVLDFWATWCGPCIAGMPELQALYEEVTPKGIKVFTVNVGEEAQVARDLLAQKKVTVPTLLDSDSSTVAAYQAQAAGGFILPQRVVIGKDGTIQGMIFGVGPGSAEEIKSLLDQAMAK